MLSDASLYDYTPTSALYGDTGVHVVGNGIGTGIGDDATGASMGMGLIGGMGGGLGDIASLGIRVEHSVPIDLPLPPIVDYASLIIQDMNDPEFFRHNVKLAQSYAEGVARLANQADAIIQNVFHPKSITPTTQAAVMTGVGGLPLPPLPIPRPEHTILTPIAMEQGPMKMPPESELADQTAAGIGVLYARQTRVRENSAAVAGLLAASL